MSEWFWKRLHTYFGWIAIFVLFGLIIFSANIEVKDFDLWLHFATGRYILANHVIPQVDVLSCTMSGKPWINHEWLFQLIVYPLYTAFGADGLISLQVFLVTITFLLLLFLGYQHERLLLLNVVLLGVFLVYEVRLTHRPDLFSLFFFVLYFYFLSLHLDKKGLVPLLFVMQVLWTNIHGFFILGPLMVLLGIMAEGIKRHVRLPWEWNQVGRLNDAEYQRLKEIFLFLLAACLINPSGLEGLVYPLRVIFSASGDAQVFFEQIIELQRPLSWGTLFSLQLYPIYKFLLFFSALTFVVNYRKVDINAFLLWLVFLLISLSAVRNIVFFALTAYFVILANLQYISFAEIFSVELRNKKWIYYFSILGHVLLIFWMINFIMAQSLRGYFDFKMYERKSEFGGMTLRNHPDQAVDFLVENKIKGNFFNDFNSGAYLLGRAHPDIKVFIDGRTELYGPNFFNRYRRIWDSGDKTVFENAVQQYQLTGVFLESVRKPVPEKLMRYLYESQDWVLVYFDFDGAIFLKDIPENQQWIAQHKIDLTTWEPPKMDLLKIGARPVIPYPLIHRAYAFYYLGMDEKALAQAKEAKKIAPTYDRPYMLMGSIALERGEFGKAYEYLRVAKILNPEESESRYLLAKTFFHLNEIAQAREQCERALGKSPLNANVLFLLSKIYLKEKRYAESFMAAQKAFKESKDQVQVLVEIGDAFLEEGQKELAQRIYTLVLQTEPTHPLIQERIKKVKQE